jgi:hypothetical protein
MGVNAITALNGNTMGSKAVGTLDTTLLPMERAGSG